MSSKPSTPADFLGDPLSDVARRERRNLLASSTIALLIVHVGLIPERISAFGIELSAPAQSALLLMLVAVVIYFMVAFVIYGFADFLVWRHKYHDYLENRENKFQNWTMDDQRRYDELRQRVPSIAWLYSVSKPVAYIRVVFEFLLPFVLGIYAALAVLSSLRSS